MSQPPQDRPSERDTGPQGEAPLGDADAVEKTTYVTGRGTQPEARSGSEPSATVRSRAPAAIVTVVVILVAIAVIVYVVGFGSGR